MWSKTQNSPNLMHHGEDASFAASNLSLNQPHQEVVPWVVTSMAPDTMVSPICSTSFSAISFGAVNAGMWQENKYCIQVE